MNVLPSSHLDSTHDVLAMKLSHSGKAASEILATERVNLLSYSVDYLSQAGLGTNVLINVSVT